MKENKEKNIKWHDARVSKQDRWLRNSHKSALNGKASGRLIEQPVYYLAYTIH